MKDTMVCGVDVVNEGKTSLLGFSASYNKSISQYFSALQSHQMYKDTIKKEGKEAQEIKITEERAYILAGLITKSLKVY